jgi:hypothetical protein
MNVEAEETIDVASDIPMNVEGDETTEESSGATSTTASAIRMNVEAEETIDASRGRTTVEETLHDETTSVTTFYCFLCDPAR